VVEANLQVSALVREVTPEGTTMMTLHDLDLLRSRQSMFALSWTVFHVVDEGSPFFERTTDKLGDDLSRIIVTMVGHDETYATTVHARHLYYGDDIRFDEKFVDVMSFDSGRVVLDFRKFHDTVPLELVD
jgi:inward rectifier potassium channel